MTEEREQAYEDAEAAARAGAAQLLERIADRIGAHAGAKAVFGEPVERDGVTVVPVAQVMIGTGAGSGTGPDDDGGAGAGGGALTRPLGYIEITADGAAFVPLKRPWQDPGLVLTYAVIVLIVSRALVKLVRG